LLSNTTTTYSTTTTDGTLSWSLTNVTTISGAAPTISGSTVTWYAGWSGSADVTVVSTGCNGPSANRTRTITVVPTVTQPAAITLTSGTEPTCQLLSNTTTSYSSSTTYGTLSWTLTNVTTISGTAPTISGNVVTWYAGWAGSADVTVVSTGCNGPSANRTRTITVTPTVTQPAAISLSSGTEPTCQLLSNTTTTYSTTTTYGTLSWSLTNITTISGTAPTISGSTVTWYAGWSGSADVTVVSTGCNGPSANRTRTITVIPTVTQPVAITIGTGTEPGCQLGSNANVTYASSTTYGALSWSLTNVTTISGTAPTISGSTVTWYAGWSGSADVTVVSTGCNGPSANRTRTVIVRATPTASVSVTGTNPVCQTGSSTVRFSGINGTTITYNINGGSNTTANITADGYVDVGTGALSVNSTYNIVDAFYTDNSPACLATPPGSATVTVVTGPIQRTVQVASTTVCSGSPGTVQVISSESGTVYQLYNTTTSANVGATQTGNGTTLNFSTGNLTSYSTFKIIASRAPCAALDMNNGIDVEIYVVSNGYWKGSVSTDWFTGGNWCLGGGIPTNATDVFIPNAATTDYDPNINNTGAVTRSINIESSGVLSITGSRNLDVWGDWNNSGTFNYNASTVTFKGTGNTNLTGFTDPQEFNNLRVDKGTNTTPLLDIGVNTTVYSNLQPINGLAKVSGGDLILYNNTTIASTAGVEIAGGNLVAGSLDFTNNGLFRVSSGNADVYQLMNNSGSTYTTTGGITTINNNVVNTAATITATGGSITVSNNFNNSNATSATFNGSTIAVVNNFTANGGTVINANSATVSVGGNYTNNSSTLNLGGAIVTLGGSMVNIPGMVNQTGGAITFNTTGGSYNSNAVLNFDGGSNLNISSGTMYFERANGGTGNDLVILSGAGTKTITGGTFQFGSASTPASQVFKVNNSVVDFNNFTINSTNTPTVQLLANAATRSSGVLTVNGVLDLNQFTFTVKNSATSAVTGSGYVLSEATNGNSKLAWNIGNSTGSYVFPFGNSAGTLIPFTFNVTTAGVQSGAGNVTVSTYPTADDNTPWLPGVGHMNFDQGPGNGTDATLDRGWIIDANNYTTKPVSDMTFTYADGDLTGNGLITEANLKAQRWNATGGPLSSGGWDLPGEYGIVNTANAGANTVTASGVSRYSPWVLHDGTSGSNSPLPIELVDFKAACLNDVVTINWTTASEVNNDYFTIQRSDNLSSYTNVAVVEGAGNSNTYRNYTAKDMYPISGTSYYRLMQTDYNGQYEVFNPVALMCVTKEADVISVFPNPANDKLNVAMSLTAADRGRILIYNHFGQLVESLFVEPKAGFNNYSFDLTNLVQGQYMVSFMMEGKVLPAQKVIIAR
jgi:hypothetical protein